MKNKRTSPSIASLFSALVCQKQKRKIYSCLAFHMSEHSAVSLDQVIILKKKKKTDQERTDVRFEK